MEGITYERNKTTDLFYKISLIAFVLGLPNFWIEDLKIPKKIVKFYKSFTMFNNVLLYALIFMELGAFFTQHNLTKKQKFNMIVFDVSHPMLFSFYLVMTNQEEKVRRMFYNLAVALKSIYNDAEVEKKMIKRTTTYLYTLIIGCSLTVIMYTVDAIWEVVKSDASFTMIVTVYPDVEDRSKLANFFRGVSYVVFWIFFTRICNVYIVVIPMTICLSHQYTNLRSYFQNLHEIFEKPGLSQTEKEDEYEMAFKIGIKMHSETLRCTDQLQTVCGGIFSGQIVFNVCMLVIMMAQMVNSERTLVNLCSTVVTSSTVLICTGFYMWNAGDITVEASHLDTAMYFSGWYNCQGQSSIRLRKLVFIAMAHAQKPVIVKGLGYIGLSYESYINIVRASYSVFSVLF